MKAHVTVDKKVLKYMRKHQSDTLTLTLQKGQG
jgi:hypothetical protein